MPANNAVLVELANLRRTHDPSLIEAAVRLSLPVGLDQDLLAHALVREIATPLDIADVRRHLEEFAKIGKPWPPGPVRQGAGSVLASRIGIKGNPVNLDDGYQSGWHFVQSNGWDSWFNIVPRPAGGYNIFTPATRLTGDHGAAKLGKENVGHVTESLSIQFDIDWRDGSIGRYVCSIDLGPKTIQGQTFDLNSPAVVADIYGTQMPLTATRPGTPVPQPGDSLRQVPRMPMIVPSMVQNTHDNGYNVTVTGSGFVPGEMVFVQARAEQGTTKWNWTTYTKSQANDLGRVACEAFGIFIYAGTKYVFRGWGEESGYTAEVG